MHAYLQEDHKILEENFFQMLDKLWDIAKTNKKAIRGTLYRHHEEDTSRRWIKMFFYQTTKGIWVERSICEEDCIKPLDDANCVNVLFVNQKILNASPKAELIKAESFDYIIAITDDVLLSLLAADYLIDKWCFHHS